MEEPDYTPRTPEPAPCAVCKARELTMAEAQPHREPWHIKKEVPLVFIVFLIGQTFGMGYWAANQQAQLDAQEDRIVRLEQQTISDRAVSERMARLEERMDNVRENTARIERLIRNLSRQIYPPPNGEP